MTVFEFPQYHINIEAVSLQEAEEALKKELEAGNVRGPELEPSKVDSSESIPPNSSNQGEKTSPDENNLSAKSASSDQSDKEAEEALKTKKSNK
jgi:hypothetical protein